jgi:rhamnose transport system permease protein
VSETEPLETEPIELVETARDTGEHRGLVSLVRWESGLVIILFVCILCASLSFKYFFTPETIFFSGLDIGEIAMMALPMTFIIITGEIDLSVASILGLSASTLGYLFMHGWNIWPAMIVCLVVGAIAGAFNGMLVTRFGLPSIAVTIGTLSLYRGIASIILGTNTAVGFPSSTLRLSLPIGKSEIAYDFAIFIVLAIIFAVVLHLTSFGRSLYAIGLQKETAFFSGIRVNRIKFRLYVLSGLVCAFAGILYTYQEASANNSTGLGLELNVVAIALLGGVSIFGGRGTVFGVVIAACILAVLTTWLTDVDVSGEVQSIIVGGLLLLSVLVPNAKFAVERIRANAKRRKVGSSL